MTRKDYVLISKALRLQVDQLNGCIGRCSLQARDMLINQRIGVFASAEQLADDLASENPRFDRARFLQACGVVS